MTSPQFRITVSQQKLPQHRRIVSEELLKAAVRGENAYRQNMQTGQGALGSHGRPYVGTGEAITSANLYPEAPGADLYTVEGPLIQHVVAEFGQEPGHMPGFAAIDRWAREKQLTPRQGETWEQMIEGIRQAIYRRGLRAFAPLQLAADQIAPTIEPAIQRRIHDLDRT